MMPLNDDEILRYNRQLVLKGFDFERQEQLKSSRILIVGLGGLGCAAAPWLASAGIGALTLVDFDSVSLSNLQRQILHNDDTLGMAKTDSAILALQKINPRVELSTLAEPLNEDNADTLVSRHDAVLDCSDNVVARECLNTACFLHKVPLISGAAIRMEGQLSVFRWRENEPCYRCMSRLFGEQNLSCVEAGVMAPLVGVIGAMQAMEAIKVVTGYGETASGKIMLYDAMTSQFREIRLMRDPDCEVCGHSGH